MYTTYNFKYIKLFYNNKIIDNTFLGVCKNLNGTNSDFKNVEYLNRKNLEFGILNNNNFDIIL